MGGLIKTQLKLLSKSRSLIVCMVIAIALGITMTLIYNYFWEQRGDKIAMSYALMRQYGMNTQLLDTALSSIPRNNLWSYINIFFSDGAIWLISCCCASSFLSCEYTMGTLKNPVSRGCGRRQIYLAKYIAGIIDVFLIALSYVGAGTVTALFVVQRTASVGAGDIVLIIICYILLLAAMAAFFMLLTVLFHRTGFSAAAAIAGPMLISSLLNVIAAVNESASSLSRYLLMESFITVEQSVLNGEAYITIITAAAYIIICSTAGYIIFNRSEIK